MAKLSLRDRVKFYREKGIRLSSGKEIYQLKKVGIDVYFDQNAFIWIAEECEGDTKITKVSEDEGKAFHFNIFNQADTIYFIGTEGLFRKSTETEEMKKIYDGKITGARVMETFGVVILYQEGNDVILQLSPAHGGIIEEIKCQVIFMARPVDEFQRKTFGTNHERRIVVKETYGYYTYTIGIQKVGIHKEAKLEEAEVEELLKK